MGLTEFIGIVCDISICGLLKEYVRTAEKRLIKLGIEGATYIIKHMQVLSQTGSIR